MAKNTLTDLNNHLFAQLERLGDEEMSKEDLQKEIERAKAISGIAKNIVENAKVTLEAISITYDKVDANKPIPEQFRIKES